MRHWRTPAIRHIAEELGFDPMGSWSCAAQYLLARASFAMELPNISIHAHPILGLLLEISNISLSSGDARYHTQDYQTHLNDLTSRLEKLSHVGTNVVSASRTSNKDNEKIVELFRLAALIYLERASRNFSGQSASLDRWTHDGFTILQSLDTGSYPFPLFILACEARNDDRRMVILRLLAHSAQKPHLPHLRAVRTLIQTAWVQDDLQVDGDLEYIRKLNLVLSSSNVIPSFV